MNKHLPKEAGTYLFCYRIDDDDDEFYYSIDTVNVDSYGETYFWELCDCQILCWWHLPKPGDFPCKCGK